MRRTELPQPRLAREGFVPAGPEKRVHKRHMLIPETGRPEDHIPTLMDYSTVICPPERRALREIVETAEVVRENGHTYLVARVSSATLDSLATFETSRADLEAVSQVLRVTAQMVGGLEGTMLGTIILQQFGTANNWPYGAAIGVSIMLASFLFLAMVSLFSRTEAQYD